MPVDDLPPRDPPDGGDSDDPFANLVLDEDFVRAASVHEAPARIRAIAGDLGAGRDRVRRGAAAPPSPRDRQPGRGPGQRRTRAVGMVLVTVAALAGLLALLAGITGGFRIGGPSVPDARTPGPAASAAGMAHLEDRSYEKGHCYTWAQQAEEARPRDVPCDSPHLFEAVSSEAVSIAEDYRAGVAYPADGEWQAIATRYCLAGAERFLGHPVDPFGRFSVGAIEPSEDGWNTGDRLLHCGLYTNVPGRGGPDGVPDEASGPAEGADQSWVLPTGACLDGTRAGEVRTVGCDAPHQSVTIGTGHLPDTTDGEPPADGVYQSHCQAVARQYLGDSWHPGTGERLGWFTIRAESWRAASHSYTCLVNYVTASGAPRTVTADLLHGEGGRPA